MDNRLRRPARALALAGLLAAGATAAAAAPASAAPFQCTANVLSGTVLGQPLAPVAANPQGSPCQSANAGLPNALPAPLATSAVFAQTALAGPADKTYEQVAAAQAGIADLNVAALPDLPIQLPTAQIPDELKHQEIDLGPVRGLLGGVLGGGVPSSIDLDLRPALQELLPDGKLPNVSVLGVRAAYAAAAARCVDGKAVLNGGNTLAGVTVLGQELPTDTAATKAVNLIDTSNIDPSDIDLDDIELPDAIKGLGGSTIKKILQQAVQPVLDGLPDIQIPATVALVKVTPGSETRNGDSLLERGPRVQVSIAGQSVADLTLGVAAVQATGVDCNAPKPAAEPETPEQQALACTDRRLVLTNVHQRGNVINFDGAAGKKDAGKTVKFFSQADDKVVQTTKVRPDGTFSAKTKDLPPKKLRFTNKARYEARIGKSKSRNLKLRRRLQITSQSVKGDKVTFKGRISAPRAKKQAAIVIKRRVSCKGLKKIGTFKPNSKGRFKITLNASGDKGQAAFFRLQSKVPATKSNPKLFNTYTLPHGVNVAQ